MSFLPMHMGMGDRTKVTIKDLISILLYLRLSYFRDRSHIRGASR